MALDDGHLIELSTLKAWLQPKPRSGIAAVIADEVGEDYTTATVTITDAKGIGAVVTPVIVGGTVASYTVDAEGNDYEAPVATVTGDGTGATAIVTVGVDAVLSQLIVDASQLVLNQANIKRFYDDDSTIVEIRHGNAKDQMYLENRPIVSISAVTIDGTAVPLSDGKSQGYLYDESRLYLIGTSFARGVRNVRVSLKAGEAEGSQRAVNAGRAAIAIATLEWKRGPYAHLVSESAPQGMGTSISINTDALPKLAVEIIANLQRTMSYDL